MSQRSALPDPPPVAPVSTAADDDVPAVPPAPAAHAGPPAVPPAVPPAPAAPGLPGRPGTDGNPTLVAPTPPAPPEPPVVPVPSQGPVGVGEATDPVEAAVPEAPATFAEPATADDLDVVRSRQSADVLRPLRPRPTQDEATAPAPVAAVASATSTGESVPVAVTPPRRPAGLSALLPRNATAAAANDVRAAAVESDTALPAIEPPAPPETHDNTPQPPLPPETHDDTLQPPLPPETPDDTPQPPGPPETHERPPEQIPTASGAPAAPESDPVAAATTEDARPADHGPANRPSRGLDKRDLPDLIADVIEAPTEAQSAAMLDANILPSVKPRRRRRGGPRPVAQPLSEIGLRTDGATGTESEPGERTELAGPTTSDAPPAPSEPETTPPTESAHAPDPTTGSTADPAPGGLLGRLRKRSSAAPTEAAIEPLDESEATTTVHVGIDELGDTADQQEPDALDPSDAVTPDHEVDRFDDIATEHLDPVESAAEPDHDIIEPFTDSVADTAEPDETIAEPTQPIDHVEESMPSIDATMAPVIGPSDTGPSVIGPPRPPQPLVNGLVADAGAVASDGTEGVPEVPLIAAPDLMSDLIPASPTDQSPAATATSDITPALPTPEPQPLADAEPAQPTPEPQPLTAAPGPLPVLADDEPEPATATLDDLAAAVAEFDEHVDLDLEPRAEPIEAQQHLLDLMAGIMSQLAATSASLSMAHLDVEGLDRQIERMSRLRASDGRSRVLGDLKDRRREALAHSRQLENLQMELSAERRQLGRDLRRSAMGPVRL